MPVLAWPSASHPPVSAKEVREIGRRVQACPHDCLIASLYATRIVAATHMQLRSIGWLLAKWRARRERTILVLDEGAAHRQVGSEHGKGLDKP